MASPAKKIISQRRETCGEKAETTKEEKLKTVDWRRKTYFAGISVL